MTDGNPKTDQASASAGQPAEQPIFSALLTPHRSLGPSGFTVVMLVTGGVSFVAGIAFWAIGAWPVVGFLGIDVLLVWLAFRWNYKSARAFEEVRVSRTEIVIRKVSPYGRTQEYRFNPFWVRLSISREEDEGVTRISLFSRGRKVDIGGFLNPDDRTSFAGAFQAALARAKMGHLPAD